MSVSVPLLIAAMLLVLNIMFAVDADADDCSSADNSADPCYSDNDDILSRQRALLPVDDLYATVRMNYANQRYDLET